MKDNYDRCFELVIGHEGGFQNDRRDRGNWTTGKIGSGELKGTKYGVSAMSYPNEDIKNLTLDRAKEIYKRDYWDACSCDDLPLGVDYIVFDIAINHGVMDGKKFLQKAVGVTVDGVIGPRTIAQVNGYDREGVIRNLCIIRAMDYAAISTVKTYGNGWYGRLIDTLRTADKMAASTLDRSKVGLFRRV